MQPSSQALVRGAPGCLRFYPNVIRVREEKKRQLEETFLSDLRRAVAIRALPSSANFRATDMPNCVDGAHAERSDSAKVSMRHNSDGVWLQTNTFATESEML